MKPRVLFITCDRVKDMYGITSGLFNSASFVVNFLNKKGYEAKLTPVVDANSIDRVVTEFNPSVVIIEALWVPPAKFEELLKIKRHSTRKWIVRIHSKAPFLANEGLAFRWIKQYTTVEGPIYISPNTKELTKQLRSALPDGNFIHLPNVYEPPSYDLTKDQRNTDDRVIDVGCFGAIRPMKNNFQQALAAIEFAESIRKRLRFHVNTSRIEQSGENVVKNLRNLFEDSPHLLIEHAWYKHKEFIKAIQKLDIGMQVSFSESFNIVTADFALAGTPIVASDDIEWMPFFLKTQPTSHKGMVRKLKFAHKFRKVSIFFQKIALMIYNVKAKYSWTSMLNKVTL